MASMDSSLLASACSGCWQQLEIILGPSPQLLEGLTALEGDSALHVVAAFGDDADADDNFRKSADVVYGKAKRLLFVQNKKGDTPLHCAARAGSSRMVALLTDFAKAEHRAKELLETENKLGETALHEAVRIGSNVIVNLLMEEDQELASLPRDGVSPLYLAILSEDTVIAETLHAKSATGMLSYSGPNGQNALHAGVLRGEVWHS
ncbi:uncharacterized protein [Aegilops tauschii subsp. strangulata]|uniref:uncharacterized protein n=1 Tax=Aegilops tauschii subsp. strangulata TaxID=200361 RepID=UPI001ABC1C33|nr:ankyrin repeat domain-containing protein 61-like [Aegilops tauschii subsp. strangulata]